MNDLNTTAAPDAGVASDPHYTLWQLVRYMLALGSWGFGGPVALAGYMYRDLVERRQWITDADYKEGLALAQLMPGPLAAQLAMYLGYVHYRFIGATLVGVAFVLPSFLMVVALGAAYTAYGGLGWMQSVFYGVGAAVIGIIAISAYKLTSKSIGRDRLLWPIFLISAAITVATQSEEVWLFLGAGVLVWFWRAPPAWLKRGGPSSTVVAASPWLPCSGPAPSIGSSSSRSACTSPMRAALSSAAAWPSCPFLYGGVVKEYGWLTDRQFVDAVAVAMITPGPVVITTGFIGFLVSGFWGAVVAALATFVPCYLFTVIPAPYFKKYGKRPDVIAFVDGVTAAAIGSIAGAVIVIGQRSITDWITAALALATTAVLWRFKKIPEPAVVAVAAVIGLIVHPLVAHA